MSKTDASSSSDDLGNLAARTGKMLRRVGIEPQRLIFAINVAVAAVLALFFAFLVDLPNTYWALLTIPLVMKQQSGLTVWRSLARFTGTFFGAIVGLAFVAFFAQNGLTMIAALACWLLAMGILARFEVGIDAYSYGVAGLTALVVSLDTGPNADMAFTYAVARTSETLIAIAAGFIVVLVVFPQSIASTLKTSLDTARAKVVEVVSRSVALDDEPSSALRNDVAGALRQTMTNLRALRFETAPNAGPLPRLRTLTSALDDVTAAAEALTFTLQRYRGEEAMPADVARARETLEGLAAQVEEAIDDSDRASDLAERFDDFAKDLHDHAHFAKLAGDSGRQDLQEVAALFRIYDLSLRLSAFLRTEAAVLDPERRFRTIPPARTRYVDLRAAIELGVRPAAAFLAVAFFWVFSAWPEGRILALITGALSLLIPTIVPRPMLATAGTKIGLGFLTMVPIAMAITAVLPYMQSFFGFAVVIGLVVFTAFYVCGAQENIPVALGATVMLAISVQPSNAQTYDPLQLVNIGASLILMPVAFVTSVTVLFPDTEARVRRHLKRGVNDLLRKAKDERMNQIDFLAQNIDLLADYGGDLDTGKEVNRQMIERTRAATHAGLELYDLREQDAGTIVDDVDRRMGGVALAAVDRRRSDDPADELADLSRIVEEARPHLLEGPEAKRFAAHRIVMAADLLESLVRQRRLSLPEGYAKP